MVTARRDFESAEARRVWRETRRAVARDDEVRMSRAIACAQAGSRDALSYLYCRYADSVRGYVRSIVRDEHAAEDITQTVFLKLVTSIRRYQPRAGVPFWSWLLAVARNAARDHLRGEHPVPVPEVREEGPIANTKAIVENKAHSIRDALLELTDRQRAVVALRHLAGLSVPEIATRIGTTEASVHGLHHRGRQTLQRALTARGAAPAVRGHAARRGERPPSTYGG